MAKKFSGIEKLFVDLIDRVDDGSNLFKTRSRSGIFSPALTIWLLVNCWAKGLKGLSCALQALGDNEASEVLSRNPTKRKFRVRSVSQNSGGLSRARQRLELDDIRKLTNKMNQILIEEKTPESLWHGRRVYIFDGTAISLTRNDKVLEQYKVSRNQHGEAYTPTMLCGCCHELFSGIALNPRFGAYRGSEKTHEANLFVEVMDEIPEKSILIADRNLGIFPIAYEASRREHQVLLRLTSTRAKSIARKAISQEEFIDTEVNWKFPGSRMEGLEIAEGATLAGRFIKWTVKRNGYRPLELLFFTTSSEPAEELVALYQQRERIENDIRTLKHTIGLERLVSKSPKIIGQELLLGVLAYNLIRSIIATVANELGLEPRQISYTRAVQWIQIFGNQIRDATNPKQIQKIRERFLVVLRQTKLPNRKKQRIEPRKRAYERQAYPRMRKSREEERAMALLILEQYGHRGYSTSVSRDY